jgi:hypothetical protein
MPFILLPGSSPWKFVSLSIFLLNALEMIRNGQKKAAGEPLIVCGSAMEGKPHLDGSRADGFMPSALYLREDEYGVRGTRIRESRSKRGIRSRLVTTAQNLG